jgi:hypothetical protein
MNRTRWIFRLVLFLVAILLLVYINRKSNDNTTTIVEFKYKTFKKLETDSLDTKRKLDLMIDETTKFIDNSSQVKKGIRYLTLLFGVAVAIELVFLTVTKRNSGGQQIK